MEFTLSDDQVYLMREIRMRGEGTGRQLVKRVFANFNRRIFEGTVHAKLRELESEGFLQSDPRLEDAEKRGGRASYYYNLTGKGRHVALPVAEQSDAELSGVPGFVPGLVPG